MTDKEYAITVTRGKHRTLWGSGYTKEKAKRILHEMVHEHKWAKGRKTPSVYSFTNPRIKKLKEK
jgi:hypothetical protein